MKKWSRGLTVFVSLAFVLALFGTATAGTLDEIAKRGELRIACQTQGPPFSFVDRNGDRTGSSIEFCEMIAKEMGVKVKFLNYDWDGLIPALLSKKADMLAADMTPTLKRAMKIAFTTPFMYTGSVVFVKQDSPIQKIEDVRKPGTKIAVLLGSTGETDAKKAFPEAELKTYKGGSEDMRTLASTMDPQCEDSPLISHRTASGFCKDNCPSLLLLLQSVMILWIYWSGSTCSSSTSIWTAGWTRTWITGSIPLIGKKTTS